MGDAIEDAVGDAMFKILAGSTMELTYKSVLVLIGGKKLVRLHKENPNAYTMIKKYFAFFKKNPDEVKKWQM